MIIQRASSGVGRIATACATSLVILAGMLVGAPTVSAGGPSAPYDAAQWPWKSELAGGAQMDGSGFIWTVLAAQVSYRGPESSPQSVPTANVPFYVKLETAWLTTPFNALDAYRMRLILPEGVKPAISNTYGVLCSVQDINGAVVRQMTAAECQNPTKVGAEWQFPAVNQYEGETVSFYLPVVADRAINGATVQLISEAISNPIGVQPNPLVAQLPMTVAAGSASAGSGGGAGAAPTGSDAALGTVTSLKATSKPRGVVLRWARPSGPVAGYIVQASKNKKKWETAGLAAADQTAMSWTKLKSGLTFYLRVVAFSEDGRGTWSAPLKVRAG